MASGYWLFLEPYVYVSILKEEALLYNTLDGYILHSKNKKIVSLIEELYAIENIGVISIKLGESDTVDSFILELREHFMGDAIPAISSVKPIQLMPHFRIDNDKMSNSFNINILSSLMEITFMANNSCSKKCKYCNLYHNQFDACTKYKTDNNLLEILDIKVFFDIIMPYFDYLYKINIIITNTDNYITLNFLENLPNKVKEKCTIIINYKNYIHLSESFISLFHKNLEVQITDLKLLKTRQKNNNGIFLNYIIQSEDDLLYLSKNKIINTSNITLFHNGDNTSFCHEQLKFNIKDLQMNVVKMQQIHQNKAINSFFYGKLYLYIDGSIRLHPNTTIIGNILKESMLTIISKIVNDKNNLWFLTRDKKKYCNNCIFKYLCPPVTPIELELGDHIFCDINN